MLFHFLRYKVGNSKLLFHDALLLSSISEVILPTHAFPVNTYFMVCNQSSLCYPSYMNIKKILVSIAFCGFSASLASSPVPHITIHKPKPPLVGIPAYIKKAARISGLPTKLIAAVVHVESRGKENAVSSAGAIGPMQLEPATAKMLHVNPYKPEQNVVGGAVYLAKLVRRFGGLRIHYKAQREIHAHLGQ